MANARIGQDIESEMMGKPYAFEMAYIPNAYEWAMGVEIKPLTDTVRRLTAHSLIAIGSGGSFTAAAFQALLHESLTGRPSYAITPYQALAKQNAIRNSAISVLSAEGKNKDVLGCFQYLVDSEPQDLMALSLKPDSPLNELATSTNFASSLAFEMPWEKDGYLATNSLLASCLLIYRAYRQCFQNLLPPCYATSDALMEACVELDPSSTAKFLQATGDSRNQSYLVVTGLAGQIAGIDLESKISESAMGTVQVVDFRSFAHGRHLWAYENRNNAAVIVIWSDEEKSLFDNLVETIPDSLPVLSIKLKGPIPVTPQLHLDAEYFYLKSAGCVGILKDWLDMTVENALEAGLETIDTEYADRHALSNASLRTVLEEAFVGENKLKDIDLGDLRGMLKKHHEGLGKVAAVKTDIQGGRSEKRGVRKQVGKRDPKRDPIGVQHGLAL